ncbi:MAG: histidine kinase [Rhodocyclaceae bacterium]|nr:histidine kinase [Rhodocyclaceae bacterium]MDZ4215999.1 histidine kinase [Rhodocyclaceae bacterium]
MPTSRNSSQNAKAVSAELAQLQVRLLEAEAQLEAIRSGASDALVGGTGVMYLDGAEKTYVAFFGAMNEGGVTLDRNGAILYCNSRFAAMLGKSIDAMRRQFFIDHVTEADRQRARALLAITATGACEVSLVVPGAAPLPVRLSMTAINSDGQQYGCLVVTDLKDRVIAEQQLRQHEHDLRAMYSHQQSMIEVERKRVAREVHDELGQILTALRMETSLLKRELPDAGQSAMRVSEMLQLIESLFKGVRSIAGNLRPPTLDLGLVPAIEWLTQDFSKRWQIAGTFLACSEDIHVGEGVATTIFRIIQESLTNVARHAHASAVRIVLEQAQQVIHLEIHDDGRGFMPGDGDGVGFGMIGMRERVQELGGTLLIESGLGRGVRLIFTIPYAGA